MSSPCAHGPRPHAEQDLTLPSVNVVRCSFPVFAARRLARGLLRSLTLHPAYGPVLVAPPLVAEAFDALFPRPVWPA